MHEMRTATGTRKQVTCLTLFPPSGKRITQVITWHEYDELGVLRYKAKDIDYETTLPFAIEKEVDEGRHKSPFHDE